MATCRGCDEQMAIDLHLEEIQRFEDQRKGKERLDNISDQDLTIAFWRQELQDLNQNLNDRRLALTVSNAMAADQHIISAILREGRECDRDHALAISLSEDVEVPAPDLSRPSDFETKDVQAEPVCEVITSLAQMSIVEEPSTTVGRDASSGPDLAAKRCVACLESIRTVLFYTPVCGHGYCNNCVRQIFLAATRDEELYPPRCCKNVFPPGMALRLLNYRELAAFCSKGVEFSCPDRTYCADSRCSTFIPPWEIDAQRARCPRCSQVTHTPCKALWGTHHECPLDEALQLVLNLGEAESWR